MHRPAKRIVSRIPKANIHTFIRYEEVRIIVSPFSLHGHGYTGRAEIERPCTHPRGTESGAGTYLPGAESEYRSLKRLKTKLPASDLIYAGISLAVMIAGCLVSWYGFVLLAVQITIWWIFLLAAIQSMTCCYDLMMMFETHYLLKHLPAAQAAGEGRFLRVSAMRRGESIHRTWFYDFVNRAAMPILAVVSVLTSIYWAADVFNMTAVCRKIFFYNFVDAKGVIQLSIFKISLVTACWFFFSYLNYAISAFYRHYKMKRAKEQLYNLTLARNVIAISVWGIYFIFALVLLRPITLYRRICGKKSEQTDTALSSCFTEVPSVVM